MKKFCKLFENDEHGQMVVFRDNNDEFEPEVKVFFDPDVEDLGICSASIVGVSEEAIDRIFDGITESIVVNMVEQTKKEFMSGDI